MDLQRLKELEKLAGLQLAGREREELLADLLALEKFACRLPKASLVEEDAAATQLKVYGLPPALDMDHDQVHSNAPSMDERYFKTPPTNPRRGGGSS